MNKKKNILLFGASQYGKNVAVELKKEFNIIGFIDNDSNKQGKKIKGFLVYSPEQIKNLSFDFIFITSMYAQEITDQLVNEIGVSMDQIEYIEMKQTNSPYGYLSVAIITSLIIVYLAVKN